MTTPDAIDQTLKGYPVAARKRLRRLRTLIRSVARANPAVGELTETLKWSEPAFLTEASRTGSTLRMAWKPKQPEQVALYFNCNTTLVDTFRSLFPELSYEGNRAIVLPLADPLPEEALQVCIEMTLTYHEQKKAARRVER